MNRLYSIGYCKEPAGMKPCGVTADFLSGKPEFVYIAAVYYINNRAGLILFCNILHTAVIACRVQ
jgi:hypothetical protein